MLPECKINKQYHKIKKKKTSDSLYIFFHIKKELTNDIHLNYFYFII